MSLISSYPAFGLAASGVLMVAALLGAATLPEEALSETAPVSNSAPTIVVKETPGPQGEPGPVGPPGPAGLQGPAGPEGPRGTAGATGGQGPAGVDGTDGTPGTDGADGARGEQGPQGERGPKGNRGPKGQRGPRGPQGIPGIATIQVHGVVNGDGTVASGTGFTVNQLGVGRYQITFGTPFQGVPTVLATKVFGSPTVDAGTGVEPAENAIVDQVTPAMCIIATSNAAGGLANGTFGFTALAP